MPRLFLLIDMSYVVCCDIRRHVYVYRQPGHISGAVDLVHRPTRQRIGTVARQQVVPAFLFLKA